MSSFSRRNTEPQATQPFLVQILWVWLSVGCTLVMLGPLQGRADWLGWLPFWAVVWPATSLLLARCCQRRLWEHAGHRSPAHVRASSRASATGAMLQRKHRGLQSRILNQQLNAIVMRSSSPK